MNQTTEPLKQALLLYNRLNAACEEVRASLEEIPTLVWTNKIEEFQGLLTELRKFPEEFIAPLGYRETPVSYRISQMEQYITETAEMLRIRREGVLPKNNDEAAYVIALGRMETNPEIIKDADLFYEWMNLRRETEHQVRHFLIDFCKTNGI